MAETERAVKLFDRTEASLLKLLDEIEPQQDAAPRARATLPILPKPPKESGGSSYSDFDVRERGR